MAELDPIVAALRQLYAAQGAATPVQPGLGEVVAGLLPPDRRTRWGLERGNIDLGDRPRVRNPDGSISTVRSAGFNVGGEEVLIPTVGDPYEGTFGTSSSGHPGILSNDKALETYARTGQHLGKFRTPEQSDRYARTLHVMQDKMYSDRMR